MYNRKQLEKQVLAELAEIRAENEQKARNTLVSARKNAEFNNSYLEIKDLEFKIAEAEFHGSDTKELKTSLSRNKMRLKQIAKSLNLTEQDFQVQYACKNCKDTGFVGNQQCACFRNKVNELLIHESGLEISKLSDFKDFNTDVVSDPQQKQNMENLKKLLLSYTEKFPNARICNILISGPTGVGKTFALECATSEVLKKGYTANFLTAFQMHNQFIKYHSCFDANKQSYLNILLDPDLLIIDDLGTEPMFNNVTTEYLYLVISERMLKRKATLISTNLNPNNIIDRYGERIYSRLFDKSKSYAFELNGSDIRTMKRRTI